VEEPLSREHFKRTVLERTDAGTAVDEVGDDIAVLEGTT
jgi:hypothetical protein